MLAAEEMGVKMNEKKRGALRLYQEKQFDQSYFYCGLEEPPAPAIHRLPPLLRRGKQTVYFAFRVLNCMQMFNLVRRLDHSDFLSLIAKLQETAFFKTVLKLQWNP